MTQRHPPPPPHLLLPYHRLFFWIFLSATAAAAGAALPDNYDSRFRQIENDFFCSSFTPLNLVDCNACCAAALSDAMGASTCLRDRRDVVYSVQRIWDCGATHNQDACQTGVDPEYFFSALHILALEEVHHTPANVFALEPHGACGMPSRSKRQQVQNATLSECTKNQSTSPPSYKKDQLQPVFTVLNPWDLPEVGAVALREHIFYNGPTVGVLTFTTDEELRSWLNDTTLKNGTIFTKKARNTALDIGAISIHKHCVSIIGWGKDRNTSKQFWLIQNSYGTAWGTEGYAKVAVGEWGIETQWYALKTVPQKCPQAQGCSTDECFSSSSLKNSFYDSVVLLTMMDDSLSLFFNKNPDGTFDFFPAIYAALGIVLVVSVCLVSSKFKQQQEKTKNNSNNSTNFDEEEDEEEAGAIEAQKKKQQQQHGFIDHYSYYYPHRQHNYR